MSATGGEGSSGADLSRLRTRLGFSEAEMAGRMGVASAAYAGLEAGAAAVPAQGWRLAESIALDCALDRRDPSLVPGTLRRKVMALAGLITGLDLAAHEKEGGAAPEAPPARRVRAEDEERGQQTTDRRYNADD